MHPHERLTITEEHSGREYACRRGMSVLEAMERQGPAPVPIGCRRGGCGVCRIQVLAGCYATRPMSRRHVSEAEQLAGLVLACRAYPDTDLRVEPATVAVAPRPSSIHRQGGANNGN